MNNKTNLWAAIVGTATFSEVVQRVAFTFGYEWESVGKEVTRTEHPVLVFDPNNKFITYYHDQRTVGSFVCKVCVTLDQVMDTCKNPPKVKKEEKIGDVEVFEDGSVLVGGKYSLSNNDVETVITARNRLMGKKQKLAAIQFSYDSPTSGQKLRRLAVTEDGGDVYSGLDMDNGNTFKRFRKDRIVGKVVFVGLASVE
jgi:hypothetical protein